MRVVCCCLCFLLLIACGSEESTSESSGTGAGGGGGSGSTGNGGSMPGPSCGDMSPGCDFGQICVAFVATAGPMTTTTYACRTNPCTDALDCSCAGQICVEEFGVELCSVGGSDADLSCDNGAD